jgi:hypothetical protein
LRTAPAPKASVTERAEERARANTLRAQIDELNAALAMAHAAADRALTEERQRADRPNEQVEALSAEVIRTQKQAEAAIGRAERAEAGRDAERALAEARRGTRRRLKGLGSKTDGRMRLQPPRQPYAGELGAASPVGGSAGRPFLAAGRCGESCWSTPVLTGHCL